MNSDVPKQEFTVELKQFEGGEISLIVPFDVEKVWGKRSQVRVKGTINEQPFRASIAPYGGQHYLGLRKEIRDALGIKPGDRLHVVMEIDTEERVITAPEDFQKALATNPRAQRIFDNLSFSHRREYVEWIESAKKPETRTRRIQKAVEQIAGGSK